MSKMLSSRCSVLTAALIGSTLALSSTLISKPAFAGTASANLNVSANVTNTCEISVEALAFGSYDSRTSLTGTGTITTICTNGASATITLDQGLSPKSGSTDASPLRQLASTDGNNKLAYGLYKNGAPVTANIWGNTAGTGLGITSIGQPQVTTVYGEIPESQSVPAGTYTDSVIATVTF